MMIVASAARAEVRYSIRQIGGTGDKATALSDDGKVAGTRGSFSSPTSLFVWDNGQMTVSGEKSPWTGGTFLARGVNNDGTVVGGKGSGEESIIWKSSTSTNFSRPSHLIGSIPFSTLNDVNNNGIVVGYSLTASNPPNHWNAAWWDSNNLVAHDLGRLGGDYTDATAVNDNGQMIGSVYGSEMGKCVALWDLSGNATNLGSPLDSQNAWGVDINDNGLALVNTFIGSNLESFTWDVTNGYQALAGFGNCPIVGAMSLNNSGEIVGYSEGDYLSGRVHKALIWDSTATAVDLNTMIDPTSGWVLNVALKNNDRGQILGSGTINGVNAYFLMEPVPEPPSLITLMGGVSMLGFAWRKQKR